MDSRLQSSFIPKEPLSAGAPFISHRPGMNLFSLLSLVVFLSVLLLGLGLFLYERHLTLSIDDLNTRIEKAKESLELGEIGEYKRLHKRIESAKGVLSGHVAVSNFFDLLEEITAQSVAFQKLSMTFSEGRVGVTLDGLARNFSSVAFQSDVIIKNRFFKTPVFSDFDLDQSGNITFKLTTDLDPALISFERKVSPPSEGEGAGGTDGEGDSLDAGDVEVDLTF